MTSGMNSLPLSVRLDPLRKLPLVSQPIHHCHDIFSLELLTYLDGRALLGEIVHHRQDAKSLTIEQRITDEVHAPALVGGRQADRRVCR